MKIKIFIALITLLITVSVNAQQFISKAIIEYEVKSNIQKTMGNDMFAEMMKENLPTFKTGYFDFTFDNNKSIYKFDHWDASFKIPEWMRRSDEENVWYFDYNTGKFSMKKNLAGSDLIVDDSIQNLQWKLISNENRIIAGFNCRKAVTKIFDSVYVFAFYTDEITIPGGPCSINGLPGMILGVTIPRLYTSWIATKVSLTGVDETIIKPVAAKKTYTMESLKSTLVEHTKDWYSDDEDNDENKQQKARFIWGNML